jgi:hypothetical protein
MLLLGMVCHYQPQVSPYIPIQQFSPSERMACISFNGYQCYRRICQSSALKMRAPGSSETVAPIHQITLCHDPGTMILTVSSIYIFDVLLSKMALWVISDYKEIYCFLKTKSIDC